MNSNIFNPNVFNGIQMEPELSPMRTGTTRSWLGEYHWVSPPITEKNKYDKITDQATEWCKNQFGKSGSRWFEKDGKFYFKDEKDMSLFILRWS